MLLYTLASLALMVILWHYFEPIKTIKLYWNKWFGKHKDTNKKLSKSKLFDGDSSIFKRFEEEILSRITKSEIYQKFGIKDSRGIILYGVPGTGKTTAILAFKQMHKINVYYITPGMQGYQIKILFDEARQNSPSLIVMEDADGYLISRQEAGFNPILTTVLNEMDGDKDNSGVFVIMTTNFYEKLDPAIKRDGRFDTHIELKPIETLDSAMKVIKAQFSQVSFDEEFLKSRLQLPLTPAQLVGIIQRGAQKVIESGKATGTVLNIDNDILKDILPEIQSKGKIGFGV